MSLFVLRKSKGPKNAAIFLLVHQVAVRSRIKWETARLAGCIHACVCVCECVHIKMALVAFTLNRRKRAVHSLIICCAGIISFSPFFAVFQWGTQSVGLRWICSRLRANIYWNYKYTLKLQKENEKIEEQMSVAFHIREKLSLDLTRLQRQFDKFKVNIGLFLHCTDMSNRYNCAVVRSSVQVRPILDKYHLRFHISISFHKRNWWTEISRST